MAADLWSKLKSSFVQEPEEPEEQTLLASLNEATTLNRTQVRLIADEVTHKLPHSACMAF